MENARDKTPAENAVAVMKRKLGEFKQIRVHMQGVNRYYGKHGTLDGCRFCAPGEAERLRSKLESGQPQPYSKEQLKHNAENITAVRKRLKELKAAGRRERKERNNVAT